MTAADTGWINDENPADVASRIAEEHRFQTPIDEVPGLDWASLIRQCLSMPHA
jgi:hypothetical protein